MKHYGDWLIGTDKCFSFGKSGYKIKDWANVKFQAKGGGQAQASGSSDAPKKNRFYSFLSMGDKETSPDVVTSMLKIFSIDVYALLDPSDIFSFFTPVIAKKFDILPDILHEPFMVSTRMGV